MVSSSCSSQLLLTNGLDGTGEILPHQSWTGVREKTEQGGRQNGSDGAGKEQHKEATAGRGTARHQKGQEGEKKPPWEKRQGRTPPNRPKAEATPPGETQLRKPWKPRQEGQEGKGKQGGEGQEGKAGAPTRHTELVTQWR